MNIVIGAFGANLTLGLISAITATTNGIYTLITNISQSTANGSNEVKKIIKETDLEVKVKTVQCLLSEIKIHDQSPITMIYCIEKIKDAIKDIAEELAEIQYRMQFNSSLWIRVRAYRFYNSRERLDACLKTLDSRYDALVKIMTVQGQMYRNDDLEDNLSRDNIIDVIDEQAKNMRSNVREKLNYINK